MSLFEGVEDAYTGGSGLYTTVGAYEVVIKTCATRESQQGKGIYTIVEYKVLEVLREFGGNDEFKASNSEGQSIGWTNWRSKKPFLGNSKGFVAAILDKDVDSVTKDDCEEVFEGDPQAFAGTLLHVEGVPIRKKNGEPFTKIVWSPT